MQRREADPFERGGIARHPGFGSRLVDGLTEEVPPEARGLGDQETAVSVPSESTSKALPLPDTDVRTGRMPVFGSAMVN